MLPVSRAEVAEAAKLVENVYRAVNIALVDLFVFIYFFGDFFWCAKLVENVNRAVNIALVDMCMGLAQLAATN